MKKVLLTIVVFLLSVFVLWGILAGIGLLGARPNGLLALAASIFIVKRMNRWLDERKQASANKIGQ